MMTSLHVAINVIIIAFCRHVECSFIESGNNSIRCSNRALDLRISLFVLKFSKSNLVLWIVSNQTIFNGCHKKKLYS